MNEEIKKMVNEELGHLSKARAVEFLTVVEAQSRVMKFLGIRTRNARYVEVPDPEDAGCDQPIFVEG